MLGVFDMAMPTISEQHFCVGSMSGEVWFQAKIVATSSQDFYCFHRVGFLGRVRLVTQQKSMRMNNSKFKKFRHLLPDLTWFECRAKCRDRLTFSSENTQNWPAFCSTNVGWMFGEMPGPLYRQALYGLRTEDSQPARCESWKLFLLTEEKRNNPQKTLVVRLRSTN